MLLQESIFFRSQDFEVRSSVFQVTMNAAKSSCYRSEKQDAVVSIISYPLHIAARNVIIYVSKQHVYR